jgi:hypothetical protein
MGKHDGNEVIDEYADRLESAAPEATGKGWYDQSSVEIERFSSSAKSNP